MKELIDINNKLENIAERFCDGYCRYTNAPIPEGKSEDWLTEDEDSPCNNCPVNEL